MSAGRWLPIGYVIVGHETIEVETGASGVHAVVIYPGAWVVARCGSPMAAGLIRQLLTQFIKRRSERLPGRCSICCDAPVYLRGNGVRRCAGCGAEWAPNDDEGRVRDTRNVNGRAARRVAEEHRRHEVQP